jgi:hypothetical protein
MTENRAIALVFVVGLAVEVGGYFLLVGLGANSQLVVLAAMLCIVAMSAGISIIGGHYEHKEIERGEDPERHRF